MGKAYEKPVIICEDLQPETMLCGCFFKNPALSEEQHCGFEPEGLGFTIFAESWADCDMDSTAIPNSLYCNHAGQVGVFGS